MELPHPQHGMESAPEWRRHLVGGSDERRTPVTRRHGRPVTPSRALKVVGGGDDDRGRGDDHGEGQGEDQADDDRPDDQDLVHPGYRAEAMASLVKVSSRSIGCRTVCTL